MHTTDDVAQNIMNERRAEIERNPSMPCQRNGCDNSYYYQEYWERRYVDGKDWNPAEVLWICDECLDAIYAEYSRRKRADEHKTLEEFQ